MRKVWPAPLMSQNPPILFARKIIWFTSAWLTLVSVRLGLTLASYRRLERWLAVPRDRPEAPRAVWNRCAWAVTRASARVPGASCLTQALAGSFLLSRCGYRSDIVVGVAPAPGGSFRAHAWLRVGEAVVLGGTTENLAHFTPLIELGAKS